MIISIRKEYKQTGVFEEIQFVVNRSQTLTLILGSSKKQFIVGSSVVYKALLCNGDPPPHPLLLFKGGLL